MKKILFAFIFILLLNNFNIAFADSKNSEPKVNAQGAVLMDFETGRVLWEKNSHAPMAMASTTKIMTAVTAIENGNLEDTVKVSRRAQNTAPVKMFLKEGEEIKLKYLLYALMLQSSNDAAVAIAEHIGGSVEKFCELMTENAKKLGAEDTVFVTPNGLDSGDHHSTAYDMALIARYALKNEVFNEIINTKNISFKSSRANYDVINKNRLLSEFDGANGVKTGFTGKAGHCFVGSAKRGDMQLISVVLASGWGNKGKEQKWVDTKRILNYGFDNFKYYEAVCTGDDAGEVDVTRAKEKEVGLVFGGGFKVCVKNGDEGKINVVKNIPQNVEAPLENGGKVGTADVLIDGQIVGSVDIVSERAVLRHDFNTSLKKIIARWLNLKTPWDGVTPRGF